MNWRMRFHMHRLIFSESVKLVWICIRRICTVHAHTLTTKQKFPFIDLTLWAAVKLGLGLSAAYILLLNMGFFFLFCFLFSLPLHEIHYSTH